HDLKGDHVWIDDLFEERHVHHSDPEDNRADSPNCKPDQRLGRRQPDVLRKPRRSEENDQSVPHSRGRREDNWCHELGSTDELPQDKQKTETEWRQNDPVAILDEPIDSLATP